MRFGAEFALSRRKVTVCFVSGFKYMFVIGKTSGSSASFNR